MVEDFDPYLTKDEFLDDMGYHSVASGTHWAIGEGGMFGGDVEYVTIPLNRELALRMQEILSDFRTFAYGKMVLRRVDHMSEEKKNEMVETLL